MHSAINHVELIIWASAAVRRSNVAWRKAHHGADLMDVQGMYGWLFRWAVETGRVVDPGLSRPQPQSHYVALVWKADRNAVKEEARNYWHIKCDEQHP